MVYRYKHPFVATVSGVAAGIAVWLLCELVYADDGLRTATRYTGRLSGLLFLFVFIARPMVDLFSTSRTGWMVRLRPAVGLMLAGNHHVHMVLLTVLLIGEGESWVSFVTNPGLYIYFILIAMNVTSFPQMRKHVSMQSINLIHLAGLYALAAAFFQTLVLSVFLGEEGGLFRMAYLVMFIAAVAIRAAARFSDRNRTATV